MKAYSVKYGARRITFALRQGESVSDIEPKTPDSPALPAQIIKDSLQKPFGSQTLREIARGKRTAAILIPGKTRLAGTKEYVPLLINELNEAGITDRNITIYLADGTHEQHLESDIKTLLGENISSRIRCLGHDCHDKNENIEIGTTSFGTPVFINRGVLSADIKVLTGRIVPHYFAGFSGGRKALIPGVAGFWTIIANHRLTLAEGRGIHKNVMHFSLDKNPVHLDMLEGARMAKPDFCLNTLLDARNRIVSVVAGDFEAAHKEGCRQAEEMFKICIKKPVDVVITSAGGLPYDSNFMQSLKAIFNVQDIVRPGGSILWISECTSGIHQGFLKWLSIKSDEEMEEAIRTEYNLTGHNSIMLRKLIRKVDIALYSLLPPDVVRGLGIHPIGSIEEGLKWIIRKHKGHFTYAVAPYSNIMCAVSSMGNK